ncbi:hypothetical protein [Calothrix sp. CCY 0018]|uniref:arsenate reductase/protein-tyrosine-phosphatase family protein n=1 Tax=Calothrix sp. CCY 0018 TaxID=3103864 RepID=UPI0039C6C52F
MSLNINLGIWKLASGYFAFYIPYSALTKTFSKGLLPGTDRPIPGFELLPATAIATTITLLTYISLMDGWQYIQRKQILGFSLPIPRTQTFFSGLATATIIATTTLNYTFTGISILFALLLMRGGVLIMAPIVDTIFHRRVQWNSWVALICSFLAIRIAFADVDNYQMTMLAVLNLSAYLMGYVFRLQFMNRLAKSEQKAENRRFFLEETMVTAIALTLIPALLALIGRGEILQQLRSGFTSFLVTPLVLPALAIGLLYACLYFFGSHIYLDSRENTFAIPLNRCSSLMSGLVASLGLTLLLGQKLPSYPQLLAAGIIIIALLCLSIPALQKNFQTQTNAIPQNPVQQIYLFICGGNTSRSPMAQAICNHEIARLLNLSLAELTQAPIQAISAGLDTNPGTSMTLEAQQTLNYLGVTPHTHTTNNVSAEQVEQANKIWCMTEAQCQDLRERFPEAAWKIQRLDPTRDIENPSGGSMETYLAIAQQLQALVSQHLSVQINVSIPRVN